MKRYYIFFLLLFNSILLFSQREIIIRNGYISLNDKGLDYYSKYLPSSVDISGSEYFPPVYQQTHWVCNQSASSYYMMTFETNKLKELNSSISENQFSVYFPWNFGNGGYGWYGDNYIITMEMMKQLGVPHLADCESDLVRDSAMWISGYDKYYELMHNRVDNYYRIKTNTISGLTTLKSWVFDHCGSGSYGGTATFLANIAEGGSTYFENGTPQEGAYVITKCGNDALHARTVVGYDDNVCFDYNGDGEYTNNIDLNDDGIIDVRDYEKGGFKLAESFGSDWQGTGYCWMMYKCFADEYFDGGIHNNNVYVFDAKIDYTPLLTAKIRLKHSSRERIKVKVGITSDIEGETWEVLEEFPIFNFQGGDLFMQGGTDDSDKTIEFGLDLTPLLQYFNEENQAKLFLVVFESDPTNEYLGEIQEFTIIDYSGSSQNEFTYDITTDLNSNSETIISTNVTVNSIDVPKIVTEALPVLTAEGDIWYPLDYHGGLPPYKWEILPSFTYEFISEPFNNFDGIKLTPEEDFDGVVELDISFNFPFQNEQSDRIRICTDGYILPSLNSNVWTQFRENLYPFFINEKVIAPLARFSLTNDYESGDGIWYETTEDTVRIRWKASDKNSEPWTTANFSCQLTSDGSIKYSYGQEYLKSIFSNIGGVSFGNQSDNLIIWMDDIPNQNTSIEIQTIPVPNDLYINQEGTLYGNPGVLNAYPFRVKITDANGISDIVQYELTTNLKDQYVDDKSSIIYPNPFTSNIIVNLSGFDSNKAEITIFNGTGKKILSEYLENVSMKEINLTHLKSGLYYVQIRVADELYHQKIVKI